MVLGDDAVGTHQIQATEACRKAELAPRKLSANSEGSMMMTINDVRNSDLEVTEAFHSSWTF